MKRPLKIVFWLIGVIVVVMVGLAILLPQFIDPNDYKQEIAGLVKKQTGRDVTIAGDLKLSVFPWLGIETGELVLSNPPAFGDEPMLTVKLANQAGEELEDFKGVTIPVRVKGKLDDPTYRLDVETLLTNAAKREVEKKLDEKQETTGKRLEDKLQRGLEKLFK